MQQLRKAKTQPTKWVIQAYTLRYFQQTAETCATLKLEAKHYGDRVPVSPKDFEKLNIDTSSLQNGGVA